MVHLKFLTKEVKPNNTSQRVMKPSANSKILSSIREFLQYHGLGKTAEALALEVSSLGLSFESVERSNSAKNAHRNSLSQNELLILFTEGERSEFFEKWKKSIPKEIQLCDKTCLTLVFELKLYFLVYPLRGNPNYEKFKENHQYFVEYLENIASKDGVIVNSSLAKFLCLGLSSIANKPLENFMINELLKPEWARDIKLRLTKFLSQSIRRQSKPQLDAMFNKNSQRKGSINSDQKVKLLEAKCIQYKGLYVQQQQEYFNVLAVATELVESLESAVLGKPVDPVTIERVCNQLFKHDVSSTIDFSRPGTASSMLRKSVMRQEKNLHSNEKHDNVASLNIEKVKTDLVSDMDYIKKGYVIQALRWRLTKSSTEEEKQKLLMSCIDHDLFGQKDTKYSEDLINCTLKSADPHLKENILRLIYCFSAMGLGCKYLSDHSIIISELIDIVCSSIKDDLIRQVTLLALQGLSLRRNVQSQMLESNIMSWLLKILQEPDNLSEYSLHHATALLMNLSLRTKGRLYLSDNSGRLLSVIEGLLEHESSLVREYINGILFSALTMENVRDAALDLGFDESLKLLIGVSPPETSHQLEFCLKQLQSPTSDKPPVEGDSEDDEEEVIEDNQESLMLDLQLPENLPVDSKSQGEELLCSQYLTEIKLNIENENVVREKISDNDNKPVPSHASPDVEQFAPDEPTVRKKTPSSRSNPLKQNSDSAQFIKNPDDRPIKPSKVDFNHINETELK